MVAMPRERSVGARKYVAWGGVWPFNTKTVLTSMSNTELMPVFKIAENLKDWTRMGPFYSVFMLKK